VATDLDTLTGVVDTKDAAQSAALLAAKNLLNASILTVTNGLAAELIARGAADTLLAGDIAEVDAALDLLATLVDANDLAQTEALAAAQTALENEIVSLRLTLAGRGVELSVLEAQGLQTSDPLGLLVNFRVVDSAVHILALDDSDAIDLAVIESAKDFIVDSGTISAVADAQKLAAIGVNLAASVYSVSGTAAELTNYIGGSAWPVDVLQSAHNISVTGTTTTLEQARTLMGVSNSGTTTFEAVNLSIGTVNGLPVDTNDVVQKYLISGSTADGQTVDLEAFDPDIAIEFEGKRGNETIVIAAGELNGVGTADDYIEAAVKLYGNAGNDTFILSGTRTFKAGDEISGGSHRTNGVDTLLAIGAADLTNLTLSGVEALQMESGSVSRVTLTQEQLLGFRTVAGDGTSVLYITGEASATIVGVDDASIAFSGISKVVVGENVTFKINVSQLKTIGLIVTDAANSAVEVTLSGVILDNENLDISALSLASGSISVTTLNGSTFSLTSDQADGATIYSEDGTGTVRIVPVASDLSAIDLTNLASNDTLVFDNTRSAVENGAENDTVAFLLGGDPFTAMMAAGSTLAQVQAAIDAAVGANQIKAFYQGNDLVLTSLIRGASLTTGVYTDAGGGAPITATDSAGLSVKLVQTSTTPALDVTGNSHIKDKVDNFQVGSGATLTINSDQVSNKTVTGLTGSSFGAVVVKLGTDNFDLSGIVADADGSNGVIASAVVDSLLTLHASADLGTFVQTTVNAEKSLALTAAQATNQTVVAVDTGAISVTGASALVAYNFASLSSDASQANVVVHYTTGGILHADTNWGAPEQMSVVVAIDTVLILTAAQANGHYIDGQDAGDAGTTGGSIAVNGIATDGQTAYDFSHLTQGDGYADGTTGTMIAIITTSTTLSATTNLGSLRLVVDGVTLTGKAAVLSGVTISEDATASVVIEDLTADAYLASVNVTNRTATVTDDLILTTADLGTNFTLSLSDGVTLTGTAAQLVDPDLNLDIVQAAGATASVAITALHAQLNADLSAVVVDGSKTAAWAGTGTFIGNLGTGFTTTVADTKTLTSTAAKLSEQTIDGAGSVTITDLDLTTGADLDAIDLVGGVTIALSVDTTLTSDATIGQTDLTVSSLNGDPLTLNISALSDGNFNVTSTETITVGEHASLTMTAAQATTLVATGLGTVNVGALQLTPGADLSGLDTADLNVSVNVGTTGSVDFIGKLGSADVAITGNGGTLDLSGLTQIDDNATFDVGANTTLKINAADVSLKSVVGSGALTVLDLADTTNLSGVNDNAPGLTAVEAIVATGGVDITGNTNLGAVTTFTVTTDRSLTLLASDADGKTIAGDANGSGTVTVTALESTPAANLGGIATGMNATAEIDATDGVSIAADLSLVDTVAITGAGTVTLATEADVQADSLFTVANGSTLSVSAGDADTIGTITASGTGAISVTGASALVAYNFASLSSDTSLANVVVHYTTGGILHADTNWGTADQLTVDITTGTLTITAAQANGYTIGGAGVADLSDATLSADLDLTNLAATLYLDGSNTGTLSVDANKTLTLKASQVGGHTFTGDGDLTITQLASDSNFSNVTTTGAVTTVASADIDISGNANLTSVDIFSVASGKVLSMEVSQVGAADSLAGSGTVRLTTTGIFLGTINVARLEVEEVLTLSAAQASAKTIAGLAAAVDGVGGSVVITGLDGAQAYLLQNTTAGATGDGTAGTVQATIDAGATVALNAGTQLGHVEVTLANTVTLFQLTAAQATDRVILGASVIEVSAGLVATQYNFAGLAAGHTSVSLDFDTFGGVHAASNFANIDTIKLAAGGATEVLAAQVSGIVFTGSDLGASVNITGSAGVQALFGSQGNDSFATGAGADTVNISQGGSDTLKFNGSASDMVVTGFVGGSGGDILDFAALSASLTGANEIRHLDTSLSDITMNARVIVFDNLVGNGAEAVESHFGNFGSFVEYGILNAQVSANDKKIFVIDAGIEGSPAADIWLWTDTADGNVQAAELQLLGTLYGVSKTELQLLVATNFIA
jgi:hypothetical protein